MSPEALLASYARRVNLLEEDVDYIMSLMQMARGLGSNAGAEAESVLYEKTIQKLQAASTCYHAALIFSDHVCKHY